MIKFYSISFRTKIQLAVVFILILSLSLYIAIASQSLKDEKTLSIIESTLRGSELIANRISRNLAQKIVWTELVIQSTQPSKKISEEPSLIALFYKNTSGENRLIHLSGAPVEAISIKTQPNTQLIIPFKKQFFWLVKSYSDGSQILSFWPKSVLDQEFSGFDQTLTALQTIGNVEILPFHANENTSIFLARDLMSAGSSGFSEAKQTIIDGKEHILSFFQIPGFSTSVFVAIPLETAYEPVYKLQKKSLAFSLIIIGLTGLLSYWIGLRLSRRLEFLSEQTQKISSGNLDIKIRDHSTDEIGQLSLAFSKMTESLKSYISEVKDKSRLEAEMKMAQTVQKTLFSERQKRIGHFEIDSFYRSASECGGDFLFFWQIDNSVFFILADVTGHGASAALMTSALRATIANICHLRITSLKDCISLIHSSTQEISKGQLLLTAFIAKADLNNSLLEYVNCSHEAPLLFTNSSDKMNVSFLPTVASPRLGDAQYTTNDFKLQTTIFEPDQWLMIYSDGLFEISENSFKSEKRLVTWANKIQKNKSSIRNILLTIEDLVNKHQETEELKDDVSLLIIGKHHS